MIGQKRALLIQPPLEDFYTTPIRLYPLGLLYTARVLQIYGWEVKILDSLSPLRKKRISLPEKFAYLQPYLNHPYFFKNYYRFGLNKEKIISIVKEYSPDLIGLSCSFAAYYKSVDELANEIKKNFSTCLIVGGNQASCLPEEIKKRTPTIDAIIVGPAEISLPLFLRNNFPQDGLKKTVQSHRPDEILLEASESIDWKKIWPAHELVKPHLYRIGQRNYASLQASRGCPFQCTFCNVHLVFGRQFECRPIESLLQEMKYLYRHHQVRIFNFEDDNLSLNREWFKEFLKTVKKDSELKEIELLAMNGLSYDTLDEELLSLMKTAGFRQLDLPLVSGQEELRRKLKRPERKGGEYFWEIIRLAKKLGYFITVYLIIGLPGQTKAEIIETASRLWQEKILVSPSIFYLAPGSEIDQTLTISEEVKNDWDKYRSTAFALETEELSRDDLISLFLYLRQKNLEFHLLKKRN
ncbi:MAG: B12-binding domain-containing radical SAM protein [Candidatus Aminicenantes bacterium]|nr:B12-binding domain-containing radical SAM protein [Candidatus Aminicenantes bacterium]